MLQNEFGHPENGMRIENKNVSDIKAKLSYRRFLILMYEGVERGEKEVFFFFFLNDVGKFES